MRAAAAAPAAPAAARPVPRAPSDAELQAAQEQLRALGAARQRAAAAAVAPRDAPASDPRDTLKRELYADMAAGVMEALSEKGADLAEVAVAIMQEIASSTAPQARVLSMSKGFLANLCDASVATQRVAAIGAGDGDALQEDGKVPSLGDGAADEDEETLSKALSALELAGALSEEAVAAAVAAVRLELQGLSPGAPLAPSILQRISSRLLEALASHSARGADNGEAPGAGTAVLLDSQLMLALDAVVESFVGQRAGDAASSLCDQVEAILFREVRFGSEARGANLQFAEAASSIRKQQAKLADTLRRLEALRNRELVELYAHRARAFIAATHAAGERHRDSIAALPRGERGSASPLKAATQQVDGRARAARAAMASLSAEAEAREREARRRQLYTLDSLRASGEEKGEEEEEEEEKGNEKERQQIREDEDEFPDPLASDDPAAAAATAQGNLLNALRGARDTLQAMRLAQEQSANELLAQMLTGSFVPPTLAGDPDGPVNPDAFLESRVAPTSAAAKDFVPLDLSQFDLHFSAK